MWCRDLQNLDVTITVVVDCFYNLAREWKWSAVKMKGWIEESGDRDLPTLLCMDEAVSNKNSRFKTVSSEVLNCGCDVVAMLHI